jgi:hypothetical protein
VPGAKRSEPAEERSPLALVGVEEPLRELAGDGEAPRGAVPVGLSEMSRLVPHDGQKRLVSPTGAAQEGHALLACSDSTIRTYDTRRE